MKIRRFVKKRRRRAVQRLENLMAARKLNAEDRAAVRRAAAEMRRTQYIHGVLRRGLLEIRMNPCAR